MGRRAHRGAIVGRLVCLPVAVLAAFPAVAGQLAGALQLRQHDSAWVAHGPQLHRGDKVRVTGAVQGDLRPGVWAPVSLTLTNPNSHSVEMNRVRVQIDSIATPHADAALPCTKKDFLVRQMPRLTLRLPSTRSTELATLGVPVEAQPWLAMRNRPVNQDGCKGAELTLVFKARGLHQ